MGFAAVVEGVETVPEAVRVAGGGLDAATGVLVFAAAEDETGFFAMMDGGPYWSTIETVDEYGDF